MGEAAGHELTHGNQDHPLPAARDALIVTPMTPIVTQPRKGPLYNPPFGDDLKPPQAHWSKDGLQ
ncbi:MAG: hypothetical protein RMJ16_10310 [Thermoguttaceae bacterium]|nr:hypothetical protein [Thermoguttaceae bacterium]